MRAGLGDGRGALLPKEVALYPELKSIHVQGTVAEKFKWLHVHTLRRRKGEGR